MPISYCTTPPYLGIYSQRILRIKSVNCVSETNIISNIFNRITQMHIVIF